MTERVKSVDSAAFSVDTEQPEADGTFQWSATTIVTVEVHAAGATGLGWTYGPPACAAIISDLLAPVLHDADPLDIPTAWSAMVRAVRNAGRPGVAGYAISAVDVAMWDLKARLLGVGLHRLLGAARQAVPVYGSGGFTTFDEDSLRHQLGGWVGRDRIPRVKIKVGEAAGGRETRDLERMAQARAIIGPDRELYVDANGGYTVKQAIRVAAEAADLDVRWLEEPVSSDDLAGLRHIRETVTAEVTAGEYGSDINYFRRMCAAEAVDCLQADASRCGGISEWLRVAAVAAAHGLEISGHCAPHLHVHAAAATPNLRHLEWFSDHVRIERLFFDGALDPTGGVLVPDDLAPGHGLTFKHSDAEPYRVR